LGERVMPGAYYVTLALAAWRRGGRGPCRLDDLVFQELLSVSADEQKQLQVIVTPGSGSDAQDIRIFSRGHSETWVQHARGTLRPAIEETGPVSENLPQVQARCRELVDSAAWYAAVAAGGLALGPS